eukprot:879620-Rhodomonas_salina.1
MAHSDGSLSEATSSTDPHTLFDCGSRQTSRTRRPVSWYATLTARLKSTVVHPPEITARTAWMEHR